MEKLLRTPLKDSRIIRTPQGIEYTKDDLDSERPYLLLDNCIYESERYGKRVTLKAGMRSDGATYAIDIPSLGWWVHDALCNRGYWDDGTKLTNWQASQVLADILRSEGRWFRDGWWKLATFFGGGGEARKNGLISLS